MLPKLSAEVQYRTQHADIPILAVSGFTAKVTTIVLTAIKM
jgi:hypothetical protein